MTKDSSLAPSLVASTFIHLAALGMASALIGQRNHFPEQNLISVTLLDPTQDNKTIRSRTGDTIKTEPPKQPSAQRKRETIRAELPTPRTTKNDISKPDESKMPPPPAPASPETSRVEGGGSASGVGNLAAGDFGVAPGYGNAGTGAGTAIAGLGRGSGAPGLPAQTAPIRTNRDDRYLSEKFQALPTDGYTAMFEKMLAHPKIEVRLNTDYRDAREEVRYDHLIFTGPIDEYYDHCFGHLPYRSAGGWRCVLCPSTLISSMPSYPERWSSLIPLTALPSGGAGNSPRTTIPPGRRTW